MLVSPTTIAVAQQYDEDEATAAASALSLPVGRLLELTAGSTGRLLWSPARGFAVNDTVPGVVRLTGVPGVWSSPDYEGFDDFLRRALLIVGASCYGRAMRADLSALDIVRLRVMPLTADKLCGLGEVVVRTVHSGIVRIKFASVSAGFRLSLRGDVLWTIAYEADPVSGISTPIARQLSEPDPIMSPTEVIDSDPDDQHAPPEAVGKRNSP